MRIIIGFFLTLLFSFGCMKNKKNSIVSFQYQGYGDTLFALLYGKVIDFENHPLRSTKIELLNSNYKTLTDSLGYFELYSSGAKYDVSIFKQAFQSVIIKGYESRSDQVSHVEIKLSSDRNDTLIVSGAPH